MNQSRTSNNRGSINRRGSRVDSDSVSNASHGSFTKKSRKETRRRRLVTRKDKKKEIVYKAIPIPKSEQELKELAEDEVFFEKTKDFRSHLRVKEMIKDRKERVIQAKLGTTDHDPLYPIEIMNEAIIPVNIEKLTKIPF